MCVYVSYVFCVCEREGICVDGAGGSVYMCGCESTKNVKVCEGVKV